MQVSASEALLARLQRVWAVIWPALKVQLEQLCEDYKSIEHLNAPTWKAAAEALEPGYFMSDRADLYLELFLLDSPSWAFFLQGTSIVHCQAVF